MKKPNSAQLRQLRKDNAKWPNALAPVPFDQWPPTPAGVRRPFAVWRSRQFLVQAFDEDGARRLSVNRTEWDERTKSWREHIGWDDLQRLKNEAGYGDRWMVEFFPADSEVVNVANMRHLWLLDQPPCFGWGKQVRAEAERQAA